MAYTTINKSTDYFNNKLYTGTGNEQAVTGMGFQPDLTWIKRRNTTSSHKLFDTNRTASNEATLALSSDTTAAENDVASSDFTSIDSDGFTVKGANPTGANGSTYVGWGWNANDGTTSSNTDGTITSTVQANTTSGFSIVSYTGNGTSGATVGHGLGSTPKMIIAKKRNGTENWLVYNEEIGNSNILLLNTTAASTADNIWTSSPTSSVFSIHSVDGINGNGNTYIAYCFAEKTGYSKFGKWTGNASTNGPFNYTGFKPTFLMWKRTDTTNNWFIVDSKRDDGNETDAGLFPDTNGAESIGNGYNGVDFLSNGFKVRQANAGCNADGGTYIWMAFGQTLVGSNNVPCTAR